MKEGDVAGLALLQLKYGLVGVEFENGKKHIVMFNTDNRRPVESIPLNQNYIYLKATCNFTERKDEANFFYSLDGSTWTRIGSTLNMQYTLPHFMGYRFGLFNYATKEAGGYVDFDYFHITDDIELD